MKIAIPLTRDYKIDEHFGHCEYYGVYTILEDKIAEFKLLDSLNGCGCKSNIAGELAQQGVTVMLAGGIGAGAINVLNHHGIEVIRGCSGDAAEVVKQYLSGNLNDSGETCLHHEHLHGHGHDHSHQQGHQHGHETLN